tara:strand:+ start:33 stop:1340 length:1308 start_codon:yes stop_codon:yes gene_type:complete
MKNKIYSLIAASGIFLISCEKDPDTVYETITVTETVVVTETETVTVEVPATPSVPETETVGGGGIFFIDDSQVWTNDRIWIMNGKVVVRDGGVLTIEEGTIVKAEDGQGVDATALVVAKGGTLFANGTASNPIVFTDKADQLSYSNTDKLSPNRVATDTGKWGGVIMLGQATVGEDGGEDDIEGIATGYDWTKYGGSLDADSSGSLNYVSIRHSGTALGNGDEIQGLTLGGVGSGTTVTNVEIVGSDDDGIEIFGGTVNVTNLTIWAQSDDAVDLDEGYAGTIDNVAVQMKASGDNIFEIDGTEDSTDALDGQFTVKNVTFIGVAGNTEKTDQLGHWKSDATGTTENVLYTTMDGQTIEGIDSDTYDASATENAVNKLIFKNFQFATTSTLASILANTESTTGVAPAWASVVSTGTVGADTSVMSWTMWYKLTQQ